MPAPTTTTTPAVAGGGDVAGGGLEQLVPVLQQLVSTIEALVQALQGSGLVTGGGATQASAGAMGAPTAQGGGHAGHAQGGGGKGKHAGHAGGSHKGHHGMTILERGRPDDPARAQQNLSAVYQTFGRHGRAGLDFKNNQTHGYLSAAERAAFRRANPGLPVPQSLVFREGSNVPIGAVYRNNEGEFDLGMGTRHTHADNPKSIMQHIWFTPNHLEFAYSDVQEGMTGAVAARMKKLGYPA